MYMLPRIVLSFVLLSSCTWVHGQGQWGIIAGPQIARVGLDPSIPEDHRAPHESGTMAMGTGYGWGMHLGISYRTNKDRNALGVSLITSQQLYTTEYTRHYGYHGLGGSSQSVWTGSIDDRLTMLEGSVHFSTSLNRHLRFELGLSPWLLLSAERHDRGVRTTSLWLYTIGSSTSTSDYDERSTEMTPYAQFGLAGDMRIMTVIRTRWTAALTGSMAFSPLYLYQSNFQGRPTVIRLSIGYLIGRSGQGSGDGE